MRLGIKNKIVISFVAGAVISFAFMGWSLFVISGLVSSMSLMQKLTLRKDVTSEMNFQIQNLLKTSGDYLISGDVGRRDVFDVLVSNISRNLDMLEELDGDE